MSAKSRWTAVAELGQSVWYDNVARPALASGLLAADEQGEEAVREPAGLCFDAAVADRDGDAAADRRRRVGHGANHAAAADRADHR